MKALSARDWPIGVRLAVGFGVTLACLAACVITSFIGIREVDKALHHVVLVSEDEALPAKSLENEITRSRLRRYRSVSEPAGDIEKNLKMVEESDSEIAKILEALGKAVTGEQSSYLKEVESGWAEYQTQDAEFQKNLLESKDQAAGAKSLAAMRGLIKERVEASLEKLVSSSTQEVHQEEMDAKQAKSQASLMLWITLVVGVILSAVAGWKSTTSIVDPMKALVKGMEELKSGLSSGILKSLAAMSTGDLTVRKSVEFPQLAVPGQDEVGRLCQTYNELAIELSEAQESLHHSQEGMIAIAGSVRQTSSNVGSIAEALDSSLTETAKSLQSVAATIEQVSAAAVESADSSGHIANGTSELARSIGDASALTDGMTTLLDKVADSAGKVAGEAAEASKNSRIGQEALASLIESLEQMRSQSRLALEAVGDLGQRQSQIGAIVKAISEISNQTNLLALNAAIEAARAGEHGRGFAVVAEEVRKLAERAQGETERISALISEIQQGVARTTSEMESSAERIEESEASGRAAASALNQLIASSEQVDLYAKEAQGDVSGALTKASDLNQVISDIAAVSQESAASSQQISAGLQEVAAAATDVARHTQQQFGSMHRLSSISDSLTSTVGDMTVTASRFNTGEVTVQDQIEGFKTAHRAWVVRMDKALLFKAPLDQDKLTKHTECALGRWVEGFGAGAYSGQRLFEGMKEDHIKLHQLCAEINSAIRDGSHDKAGRMVQELHDLSDTICCSLDALVHESGMKKAA